MKKNIIVKDKEFEPFLSGDKVLSRTKELAAQISQNFAGKEPTFLVVMNGAMFFGNDLLLNTTIPSRLDSIRLKSYSGTKSTGVVKVEASPKNDLKGRDVIIVEDVVDTGITIEYATQYVKELGAASVHTAALLFKEEACTIPGFEPDYVGFVIPNRFVVGRGFDYDEEGRHYPDIYSLVGDPR